MTHLRITGLAAALLAVGLVVASGSGGPARGNADDVDLEGIAQKVVTQTAGVREGDLVLISGAVRDLELLENLAVNARKVGAGESLQGILASAKELRVTNPNGTDFKVGVAGRPVFVSDGVISDADTKRGGAATQVWLPAGEVFLTPVPGTAKGTVVVDRDFFQGKEIHNLRLTFAEGKVTSMKAESGLEPFQAYYDAAGAGRDEFGYVDIGINPGVRVPAGSRMVGFMPAGMVTVGIGNNTWAGGENDAPLGTTHFLPGSTVEVDGREIVADGVLKL
jgi:leucyl aminopeptidase (aminopeptidase T)